MMKWPHKSKCATWFCMELDMVACDHMGSTKVCNGWAIGTKFSGIARGPRPSLLWGFNKPLLGYFFNPCNKKYDIKSFKVLNFIAYLLHCSAYIQTSSRYVIHYSLKALFFIQVSYIFCHENTIVGSFVTCDVWPANVDRNALKNWRENSDIHFMHKKATFIPYWVVLKYEVHSW